MSNKLHQNIKDESRVLEDVFKKYTKNLSKPTAKKMIQFLMSLVAVTHMQSVNNLYDKYLSKTSDISLNSLYYLLKNDSVNLESMMNTTLDIVLDMLKEDHRNMAVLLSIDDTSIEKFGRKFDDVDIIHDHACHNGSAYMNGHCFVCIMIHIPVLHNNTTKYISIPLYYRMKKSDDNKLDMAAEMICNVMNRIDSSRQVILMCDSWYPKGAVIETVQKYPNLEMIAAVRIDTAIYDFPESKKGRGRPALWGNRLNYKDFQYTDMKEGNNKIAVRTVLTKLFGPKQNVYCMVTYYPKSGTYRMFISTVEPQHIKVNNESNPFNESQENIHYLPLNVYKQRWNIEVSFYEQKTFWGLKSYMVRSSHGINMLVNCINVVYVSMKLLPYQYKEFVNYCDKSPQYIRDSISIDLWCDLFLRGLPLSA